MVTHVGTIFDSKGLNLAERFLHTLPLLAKSALKVYEASHPTTYAKLCDMLTQRFSDKHERFLKFQELIALRQLEVGWTHTWINLWSCRRRSRT